MPAASIWCDPSASSTAGKLPILVFSGTIATADEVRELAALGVSGYVNEYSAVQHILPSLAPHLFPDNFNRRGSPRVVLGIPVALSLRQHDRRRADAEHQQGRARDPHDEPARAGRKVRVRFRLPGSKRDIEAESRDRVERSPGRDGAAVREGRSGRPGRDRRVRRSALLLQPKGLIEFVARLEFEFAVRVRFCATRD